MYMQVKYWQTFEIFARYAEAEFRDHESTVRITRDWSGNRFASFVHCSRQIQKRIGKLL